MVGTLPGQDLGNGAKEGERMGARWARVGLLHPPACCTARVWAAAPQGRAVPRWLQHCCALGGLPTPWSGFGRAADAMSSILSAVRNSAHGGIQTSGHTWAVDGCQLWGQPHQGFPCFRIGHHVTSFVSFCDFDGLHIFPLCCALLLQSRVKIGQNV